MDNLEEQIWSFYRQRMCALPARMLYDIKDKARNSADLDEIWPMLLAIDEVARCDDQINASLRKLRESNPRAFRRLGERIAADLVEQDVIKCSRSDTIYLNSN